MELKQTRDRRHRGRDRWGIAHLAVLHLVFSAVIVSAVPGIAEESGDEGAKGLVDALVNGKPTLNVRGRIEVAKTDPLERSEAYTIRTELGYGTKPWYGVRVYTSFENVVAATEKTYFNPTDPPNSKGQTTIADPPGTEVQTGFLEVDREDWLDSQLRAGRQYIIYDDWRFIGNVVWRQNQQTFDAVHAESSLGLGDFSAKYGWIGNVNRIFGGGGSNPELRDFESNSHIINVSYKGIPQAKMVAFAYLLDLENPQSAGDPSANSNQSYGFILDGAFDVGEKLVLDYFASYVYQTDYGDKQIDYRAHYVHGAAGVKWNGLGRLGAGYEMLGSDDGAQQFLTPLATAHKFNGWADVYLNNGGPTGLRDLYLSAAPALPWKLAGQVVYHRFWDDFSGDLRGNEIDAELKRPFGKHFLLLTKGAYFMSASDAFAETDTWRFWFDVVVKF